MGTNATPIKKKKTYTLGDCIGIGIILLLVLFFYDAMVDADTPRFSFLYIAIVIVVVLFALSYISVVADSYWASMIKSLKAKKSCQNTTHIVSEETVQSIQKNASIKSMIWLIVLSTVYFLLSGLLPKISAYILLYACLTAVGIAYTWAKTSKVTAESLTNELNTNKPEIADDAENSTNDSNSESVDPVKEINDLKQYINDSLIVETRILGRDPIYEDQQTKEYTHVHMPDHIIPYPATTYKTRQVQTGVEYTFLVFYRDGHKENERVREGSQRYQLLIQYIK